MKAPETAQKILTRAAERASLRGPSNVASSCGQREEKGGAMSPDKERPDEEKFGPVGRMTDFGVEKAEHRPNLHVHQVAGARKPFVEVQPHVEASRGKNRVRLGKRPAS
jgi:hypothetical protein